MKLKTLFVSYWRWLATVGFAVAVFCFWLFWLPFLMMAREQAQLFLWNTDYLMERLALPGGLAQYLGEYVVQFFLRPVYGALWYAVLLVAMQLLTLRLLKNQILSFVPSCILWYLACNPNIPMTLIIAVLLALVLINLLPRKQNARGLVAFAMIPIGYWLIGPAVVLLAVYILFKRDENRGDRSMIKGYALIMRPVPLILLAFCIVGSAWLTPYPLKQIARGIDYYWEKEEMGSFDEMEYDMLMRLHRWDEMVGKYNRKGSESLAVNNAVTVVMWQQQRISQQEMTSRISLDQRALVNIPTAFLTSELCIPIGMTNVSQRAAFEAMEAIPNYNKSGRALQRLVETNLITGEPKVALKYIAILEQTTFYRGWARKMKALALQPELLKDYPNYYQLKEMYDHDEDRVFY